VVDDGSTDHPEQVVAGQPSVHLIRQANRGPSAARNAGLRAACGDFVLFLDADDLLTPVAIEAGLACFEEHPEAAFVYGAHRRVDIAGAPVLERKYTATGGDPLSTLLRHNVVEMHGAVMYRRDLLLQSGGFDERLRACEDYDVYLRMARRHPIASHPVESALYRRHGTNMSGDARLMLSSFLRVHRAHRPRPDDRGERMAAWREGRRTTTEYYVQEFFYTSRAAGRPLVRAAIEAARLSPTTVLRMAGRSGRHRARRRLFHPPSVPLGSPEPGRSLDIGGGRPDGS
jgi:glycosyltransferase involved in cell wall biosynthesis